MDMKIKFNFGYYTLYSNLHVLNVAGNRDIFFNSFHHYFVTILEQIPTCKSKSSFHRHDIKVSQNGGVALPLIQLY